MPATLDALLEEWTEDDNGVKPIFSSLYALLRDLGGVSLTLVSRPGVSHSLRASFPARTDRPLFVLVDLIDDEPGARWLSICFYADLVSAPQGRGDVVPGGLMGEDACCFDVDSPADGAQEYLQERLREAYIAVSSPLHYDI